MSNPMWTCPKCGVRLVTAGMYHSCGVFSLDDLFAKSEPIVLETFRTLEAMVVEIEPSVIVIPQKTRVAFQILTRFAGGSPRKSYFDAGFIFLEQQSNKRFHKVETFGLTPGVSHRVRLYSPRDIDDDVRTWLMESMRYGRREHIPP